MVRFEESVVFFNHILFIQVQKIYQQTQVTIVRNRGNDENEQKPMFLDLE